MTSEPNTPELNKLKHALPESRSLSRFLDWLEENDMRVCKPSETEWGYDSISENSERLLARYFEIDLERVEDERRALLDYQRSLNEKNR